MSQITIRMIPDVVESEIRRISVERRISLSKAAIFLLQRGLGIDPMEEKKRDFSNIFGEWDQAEYNEFCENTKQFGEIDAEIWR